MSNSNQAGQVPGGDYIEKIKSLLSDEISVRRDLETGELLVGAAQGVRERTAGSRSASSAQSLVNAIHSAPRYFVASPVREWEKTPPIPISLKIPSCRKAPLYPASRSMTKTACREMPPRDFSIPQLGVGSLVLLDFFGFHLGNLKQPSLIGFHRDFLI